MGAELGGVFAPLAPAPEALALEEVSTALGGVPEGLGVGRADHAVFLKTA